MTKLQQRAVLSSLQRSARHLACGACPVNCGDNSRCSPNPAFFCLDVVRMSHAHTNSFLDQYEQDVDEIVAACNGDLRGAVKAI